MRWAVAAAVALAGCGGRNPYEAKVDEVLLADADRVIPAQKGALVKLTESDLEPALPELDAGATVRIAADRTVEWHRVQDLIAAVTKAGGVPHLLVGYRDEVHGFLLEDDLKGPAIQLTPTPDGKFCVGPPDNLEARCVVNRDRAHVNRAFVREEIRGAYEEWGLTDVDVLLPADLEWADVVRTIDGARTCCGGVEIRVGLHRD